MKTAIVTLIGALGFCLSASFVQSASAKGKYASVNGLKLYYEIHGTGEPLILLHGGLGQRDPGWDDGFGIGG